MKKRLDMENYILYIFYGGIGFLTFMFVRNSIQNIKNHEKRYQEFKKYLDKKHYEDYENGL